MIVNNEARTVKELLDSLVEGQDLYIIYGFTGKDRRVKVLGVDEYGTVITSSKPNISPKLMKMLVAPRYIITECVEKGWIETEEVTYGKVHL